MVSIPYAKSIKFTLTKWKFHDNVQVVLERMWKDLQHSIRGFCQLVAQRSNARWKITPWFDGNWVIELQMSVSVTMTVVTRMYVPSTAPDLQHQSP